jgi:Zn-dependent protease with chaperone function
VITGQYFDGNSATSTPASLEFGSDGQLHVHGLEVPVTFTLASVEISDRIKRRYRLVHWLESRWPVAMASLVAVGLLTFGFLRWGVPAIANWAAEVIPTEVDVAIGTGTLDVLDQLAFYESRLPADRQHELQAKFAWMIADLDDGHAYQLVFRNGGRFGANAFALPSGIVVVTDQLVELSETDNELVAVLAHEIGHVRARHALRQLLQAAGVSAMAMALLGDVSSTSGVLSAAPALLHAKHSREFETEADEFAKQWLRARGIDDTHFDAILCRMSEGAGDHRSVDFFASHPPTSERATCTD